MAITVLGKRSAAEAGFISTRATRSKRVITPFENKENLLSPKVASSARKYSSTRNTNDVDELAEITPIKSRVASVKLDTEVEDQLKPIQIFTPQTPRHRDAASKHLPSTPRHRVMVGKTFTPQTPRTPSSGNSFSTIYNSARLLFARSSDPGRLVGRDTERAELTDFVTNCIESKKGGCTYVSGPPGTGKSALVNEVVSHIPENHHIKKVYINCMSLKTSNDIYGILLEGLCDGVEVLDGDEIRTLQGMFVPRKMSSTVYIITMDEMDHILSLDLEFLYKLFEWSLHKSSCLVLLGIANALDLTDRFLPRLKARDLKPDLLPFLPYSAPQIKAIITSRLKSLLPADTAQPEFVPFLHPAAIEICSRKVAGQTGDLRKALDIVRRALDLVEAETKQKQQETLDSEIMSSPSRKKVLVENNNLSTPQKVQHQRTLAASLATLTVETAPRATITHVNKITHSTFSNGNGQRLKTLNLQQKAALCSLVAHEKRSRAQGNFLSTPLKSRNLAPSVKNLYTSYCKLCKFSTLLTPLSATEFRDVIGGLETLSLIQAVNGKNGSFMDIGTPSKRKYMTGMAGGLDEKKLASCVGEKEMEDAIDGLGSDILRRILGGEGLE